MRIAFLHTNAYIFPMNASEKLQVLVKTVRQTVLAERLGVSQPTISRVIRGIQVPSEPLVRAIDAMFSERAGQSTPASQIADRAA